jgi:cysteinyl-tRNA synthetase
LPGGPASRRPFVCLHADTADDGSRVQSAVVRSVRLHDTRTGRPVTVKPGDGRRVGIYACGPTVYSRVHVGNARPYVVFLLLARFLRHEGYDAVLVANVTDINDKIYDAARAAS